MEMKNPNTPDERRISEIKNSFLRNSTSHDAKIPANTTSDVSAIIATEMPSTPTA
jgi:hypothetical protein